MYNYKNLATLLEYPGCGWQSQLQLCARQLRAEHPAIIPLVEEFLVFFQELPVSAVQEKYTQTFDLNPVCTLEVGYHLFGENYKRGLFLANLRETESAFELGQDGQLPDYLPVMLRLLDRLEDEELRSAIIFECMIPALTKMIEATKTADSPYGNLLLIILSILECETRIDIESEPESEMSERNFYV
jgi:nitrate reductase molybdenum cofactor assembly chaperone NarJ/NarW